MKLRSNRQQTKPRKINKLVLICGAFVGFSISNPLTIYAASPTSAPRANALITWTASGKQSKKVDVLFSVQNVKNITFSKGKLVLRGVKCCDRVLHRSSRAHGGAYGDHQAHSVVELGKGPLP